jgi:hypothetical protein
LQEIIDESVRALRGYLDKSNKAFVTDTTEVWVKREPNQIILTTSLTFFTLKMEETFSKIAAGDANAMQDMFNFKVEGLTGLIDLVRTKLTKAERMKIMCLITLDAHSRDISFNLGDAKVTERTQFEWQSQLRFEWREKENDCYINIVDAGTSEIPTMSCTLTLLQQSSEPVVVCRLRCEGAEIADTDAMTTQSLPIRLNTSATERDWSSLRSPTAFMSRLHRRSSSAWVVHPRGLQARARRKRQRIWRP